MKKITLFDTSQGTHNMGDFIINEAITREMAFLFNNNFLVRYGTHNPLLHHYQLAFPNPINRNAKNSDLKFLGGTNLFKKNLLRPYSDWSIDLLTSFLYKGSISLGCGLGGVNEGKINGYTSLVYKKALSKDYIHSVRDEATKDFLNQLGFEAYNTGCPTLWGFDDKLNASIPKSKSEEVVFTLTDYMQSPVEDRRLIEILKANYSKVHFWVQGSRDLDYVSHLTDISKLHIINPNLDAYRECVSRRNIDYVGTRLHAGIFAMQHGVRSIILAVDNRARDMHKTNRLNVIERNDIEQLPDILKSTFDTNVTVDQQLIESWKAQFKSE